MQIRERKGTQPELTVHEVYLQTPAGELVLGGVSNSGIFFFFFTSSNQLKLYTVKEHNDFV